MQGKVFVLCVLGPGGSEGVGYSKGECCPNHQELIMSSLCIQRTFIVGNFFVTLIFIYDLFCDCKSQFKKLDIKWTRKKRINGQR